MKKLFIVLLLGLLSLNTAENTNNTEKSNFFVINTTIIYYKEIYVRIRSYYNTYYVQEKKLYQAYDGRYSSWHMKPSKAINELKQKS